MSESAFTITVYDSSACPEALAEAVGLYSEIYAEPPYLEDEDDFARFAYDLPRRSNEENFRLVIARLDLTPIGFALGHPLSSHTSWWSGAVSPLPDSFKKEHFGRTFAVIELAVQDSYRRRRIGRRLHDHLLAGLNVERATLLVLPDALPANAAYRRWGYSYAGQIQPFPEGPTYNSLVYNFPRA